MSKYLTVVLFLALFLISLAVQAGEKPALVKPAKLPSERSVLESNPGNYNGVPSTRSIPVVSTPQLIQRGAFVGRAIGTTTYDLVMNWSDRRTIAVHLGSNGLPDYVNFAYIKRTGTPTPDDREDHYSVFNVGANTVTDLGPVIPYTTRTTYFPSVAAFQGGLADALVAFAPNATSSSQPLIVAINATPYQGDFSLTTAVSPGREGDIEIDNANQIIYVSDNHLRAGIRSHTSSDYGTTWNTVDVRRTALGADTAFYSIGGNATLDFPTLIAPNGNYAIVANMRGTGGSLPPLGTGTPSNASGVFIFTSTNRGATWSATKIWNDGQLLPGPGGATDSDYVPIYGWGVQTAAAYDRNSNFQLVFNGTAFHSNGDGTYSLVAQALHWNQATGMKRISDPAISHYPLWDSMNVGNPPAPTNADNLSFPAICANPTSDVLLAVWEQPSGITSTYCDTAYGHARLVLMGSQSEDGGATWSTPFLVAESTPRGSIHQAVMDPWMTPGNIAHIVAIDDTINGLSVFTETGIVPVDIVYFTQTVTGVEEISGTVPDAFHLAQNYPNPFNPSTKIQFGIPKEEFVSLKIYNLLGQEVKTLVSEVYQGGTYEVTFDAEGLPSGVYFYKLSAGSYLSTKKMLLLK